MVAARDKNEENSVPVLKFLNSLLRRQTRKKIITIQCGFNIIRVMWL